jgi:hypothetical protein
MTFPDVAPASRQGDFFVPANPVANPGGLDHVRWSLDIPQADYENPSNEVVSTILVNGVDWGNNRWAGGRIQTTDKQGNPVVNPVHVVEFKLGTVPVGATLQIRVRVNPGTGLPMNVGTKNAEAV